MKLFFHKKYTKTSKTADRSKRPSLGFIKYEPITETNIETNKTTIETTWKAIDISRKTNETAKALKQANLDFIKRMNEIIEKEIN